MESGGDAVNFLPSAEVDGTINLRPDSAWQKLLRLVLPPRCVLCSARGTAGMDLCQPCRADLPWLDICCPRCAQPLPQPGLCGRCLSQPPAFAHTLIPLRYEAPVDRWVQGFKFHRQLSSGRLLSRLLLDTIRHAEYPLPQALIPVPSHHHRLRRRGYNQAAMVAHDLSHWLRLPVHHALRRVRATPPQAGLSEQQRRRNLRAAFAVQGPLPHRVALIDDVVTTGSTIRACARALRAAGAREVAVWALARTP